MTNRKIILVTGFTDGISKAIATELARQGAQIILHGRSPEKIKQTQDEIYPLIPEVKLDFVAAE